jgi:hypothetical protein
MPALKSKRLNLYKKTTTDDNERSDKGLGGTP